MTRVEPDLTTLPPDRFKWPRRALFTVAVLGASAFLVYAFRQTPDPLHDKPDDPAIVRQVPAPGSHVLPRAEVGLLLKPGYDGRITVDGVTVPEAEMNGAVPTTSPEYDPSLGPRPNTKNEVLFTPGKGKVFTKFRTGDIRVSVRYWKIARGERAAKVVSWTISVG